MTLPLPFRLNPNADADPESIQTNFEALAARFPVSRKDVKLESVHNVGDVGEPAFQNGWINYDTTAYVGARFWKDPVGVVHIEGLIKLGTVGSVPAFTLPDGYLPGKGHIFIVLSNGAAARVDVAPTGQVNITSGSNVWVSLAGISFRQEH